MDVAERIAAREVARRAKELLIRGAVVQPPPLQIEYRDVLANALGNQLEELPLFAQTGFKTPCAR